MMEMKGPMIKEGIMHVALLSVNAIPVETRLLAHTRTRKHTHTTHTTHTHTPHTHTHTQRSTTTLLPRSAGSLPHPLALTQPARCTSWRRSRGDQSKAAPGDSSCTQSASPYRGAADQHAGRRGAQSGARHAIEKGGRTRRRRRRRRRRTTTTTTTTTIIIISTIITITATTTTTTTTTTTATATATTTTTTTNY